METSSLDIRNVVSVITGLMGSGKTWLLSRLFNQIPPGLYTSTGIAEKSFRGLLHHIGKMSLNSWELFSYENILEFLACVYCDTLQSSDIANLAAKIAASETPEDVNPLSPPAPAEASSPAKPFTKTPRRAHRSGKKSTTSHSIMRLVQAPKMSLKDVMLELVHMIDTGGQPEFLENMLSVIHNIHLGVLVMNLVFGLDVCPPIDYHEKGKPYKRALPSQYTNKQIIQKLASTLQAKRFSQKEGQVFRLLVVATHKDCVPKEELPARVKAFDQALRAILLPACEKELILYSEDEIPFVLNLKSPDSDDLEKLDIIRKKISDSKVGEIVKTPGCFLIFEQELVEYAKKVAGRDILSIGECVEVGAQLQMEPEVVMAALIFFHRQITLLYFRYVLPNLVFIKPQIPLDCINAIVELHYKVHTIKGVTRELISSLNNGIVTEEILSHELLSRCFIPELYEPHHAIDLLCHNFTLAPLSREVQSHPAMSNPYIKPKPSAPESKEYLMMTLRPAIPEKDIPKYIPKQSMVAYLVVKFTKDCVPLSCFGRTISCLLAWFDWKLSRGGDGSPKCLAHNIASLFIPQTPGQVILVDTGHCFEIHINVDKGIGSTDLPKICLQVRETIFSAIKHVFECLHLSKIEISPAFTCPCSEESSMHFASAYEYNSKWLFRCHNTGEGAGRAEQKHIMWLETPSTEAEKPTLPKLLDFNVHKKVADDYYVFGIKLLNDEEGCILAEIEHDCLGKCQRIILKILSNWLRGKGKSPTWKVLIVTLQECGLNVLADEIQQKHK